MDMGNVSQFQRSERNGHVKEDAVLMVWKSFRDIDDQGYDQFWCLNSVHQGYDRVSWKLQIKVC